MGDVIPFSLKKKTENKSEDIYEYAVDVYRNSSGEISAIIKDRDSYESDDLYNIADDLILLAFLLYQQAEKAGKFGADICCITRIHKNNLITNRINTDLIETAPQHEWLHDQLALAGELASSSCYDPPSPVEPSAQ